MVTVDNSTTCFNGLSTDEKPIGGRNGDMFYEIDTGALYAYDEQNQTWVQQASGGSGGGGGSETVVTILESDVEFERYMNGDTGSYAYSATITPTVEPQSGSNLTVTINGYTVELLDAYPTTGYTAWGDDLSSPTIIVTYIQGDDWWQIDVFDESIMPSSEEQYQTVPVKITQDQSGSGGGSDSGGNGFSTASITIQNDSGNKINCAIPGLFLMGEQDTMGIGVVTELFNRENGYTVPLYNGQLEIMIEIGSNLVTVSDNIDHTRDSDYFIVTGNGEILIELQSGI